MSGKLKKLLCMRVIEHFNKLGQNITLSEKTLTSCIQTGIGRSNTIELQIPIQRLNSTSQCKIIPHLDNFPVDELFYSATINNDAKFPYMSFKVNTKEFITNSLHSCTKDCLPREKNKIKTIVEFSSPNIAKPFHMGHLRSTIIGNFIANIKEYLGENILKLNYLGDWGTQFGFLKVGMDKANINEQDLKNRPIQCLYEAYVYANKLAETDTNISKLAREVFAELEKGQLEDISEWKTYRKYTINELTHVYHRLGVKFDRYDWESMYNTKSIENVIQSLENKNIIKTLEDGKKVVSVSDRIVTVMKSDGSSLYLARDIAAAIDRHDRYKFDNMYYIVDNAQTDHFGALFDVFKQMEFPWSKGCKHVKFGRIRGMSTRKGKVIFLNDILDEARDVMHKKQLESPTTKVNMSEDNETTDILGISAVIINDLKQRRTRDYEFDWTNALNMQGDSGIKLQHTHCRLHNLELNCGQNFPEKCDPEFLLESEAVQLIKEISRFDEVLVRANEELEACILVKYLISLCNSINRALKELRVKDQGAAGGQRLLMFHCAKLVLNQGMKILGLKPLNAM